jgi:hypothetical protein
MPIGFTGNVAAIILDYHMHSNLVVFKNRSASAKYN